MRVHSLHQRDLAAPAPRVGALLHDLGTGRDSLWPNDHWPPLLLDRPLAIGAAGGHGPIRYHVDEIDPERVRFRFSRPRGLTGVHEFIVEKADPGCRLSHLIDGEIHGRMLLLWPLVIRPLHDALIEDALDRAEAAVTGAAATPARWSFQVRLLRLLLLMRRRSG